MRRLLVGPAALLALACGGEPGPPTPDAAAAADASTPDAARAPADLVRTGGWTLLAPADDPFADHADPARPCDPLGLKDEDSFFEIDTRICAAASVAQPIAAEIRAGDALHALVWHLDLIADPPATGHVALTIGDHVLVDELVPIPSQERLYEVRRAADFTAPAGARAVFHVHNHGYNNWRIAYVRLTPGG